MKTMIKVTAAAVIAFLAVLSCSPEVSLTDRDYKAINNTNNPGSTNYSLAGLLPTITSASISNLSTAADSNKEITITFPEGADFLRKSNDNIQAELEKFLTLFTYVRAGTDPNVQPGTASKVGYEFARRVTTGTSSNTSTAIVIKVPSVPSSTLKGKIDGTAYTVNGSTLDINGDGIAGEAIYDDLYFNVTISGTAIADSGTWVPVGGPTSTVYVSGIPTAFQGYSNWTLTISNIAFSLPTPTGNAAGETVAVLTGQTGFTGTTANDIAETVLSSLAGSFKIQQYSDSANTWVDTAAIIAFDTTAASATINQLAVRSFVAADMGIYRIYASGLSNLVTEDEYYGAPQKISVSYDFYNDFYQNVFVTEPEITIAGNNPYVVQATSPLSATPPVFTSDHKGQNVTVQIYFQELPPSSGTGDVGLAAITDFDTFNKNFKLAYHPTSLLSSGNWYSISNLQYIKIVAVDVGPSVYFSGSTQTKNNLLTLTLDPKYVISGSREVHLLLAPGFKYTDANLYFGDPSGINKRIGDTNRFEYYGSITGF